MSGMDVDTESTSNMSDQPDLSLLLASDHFSIPLYLNQALSLSTPASSDESDQALTSLALQLQLQTRAIHDEIGQIAAELRAVLPRCAADVTRLEVGRGAVEAEARNLWRGMGGQTDNNNTNNTDNNNNNPVGALHILLNLQTNLTAVRHILAAAARWDETLASIPGLLATCSFSEEGQHQDDTTQRATTAWDHHHAPSSVSSSSMLKLVNALSTLEAGARALRGMPQRSSRDEALHQVRSRVEIVLLPQLMKALRRIDSPANMSSISSNRNNDTGRLAPLKQCVEMYASLNKIEVVREEYVKSRPQKLLNLWFSFTGGSNGRLSRYTSTDGDKLDDTDAKKQQDPEIVVEDFDFSQDELEPIEMESSLPIVPPPSQPNQQSFVEFLANFYQAVLELLSNERTQATVIFGAELAPLISVRVLQECFKPIVASFEKRLASLCPVSRSAVAPNTLPTVSSDIKNNSDSSGSSRGSLEAIAVAYESTLQFLSLAYDQIETWDASAKSGGDVHQRQQLQISLRQTFLLIASPFVPYQRALAESERDFLGEAAIIVAKDIRSVANSFEDAAERLADLAPFMFPLVETVMHRYELLNSGYNLLPILSVLDTILANHASELSFVMRTLSGYATSPSSSTGSNSGPEFDEQHVHCSLEILRIAGMFQRNLKSFEQFVRERLKVLSNQISDTILESSGVSSSIVDIPDSLTVNQIRSMLAKEACNTSPDTSTDEGNTAGKVSSAVMQLRRMTGSSKENEASKIPPPLFSKAFDSTLQLARSCQSFVFEVCYAIPERHLRSISALPIWKLESPSTGVAISSSGSGITEDSSYGILPQSFITHVGEHMLALVQALEPFASDSEALGLANEVMIGVRDVAIQPWKEFVAAAGCSSSVNDHHETLQVLMSGKSLTKYLSVHDDVSVEEPQVNNEESDNINEGEEGTDTGESDAFCNQWLDVVGIAVTGRLLERTMRIPRLGRKGAEHLAADLNYIRNVFTALGVSGHPNPLLTYAAQLVVLEEQLLRERIQSRREELDCPGVSLEAIEVIRKVELRIAYVRNIAV